MKHSVDFINKTKELYPFDRYIHKLVDKGDPFLGSYLKCEPKITVDYILETAELEELKSKARLLKARYLLYLNWLEKYRTGKVLKSMDKDL